MCDTLCGPGADGMVFAKNSDRPIGEVQLATPYGRRATQGCTLRTQYLSIGDTGAHAAFLSSPTWLWGAEHGVNEYGVAIGNERVSTTHDAAHAKPGLIGMDLVRLGLERSKTAEEALHVITELIEHARAGWHRRPGPPGGLRQLVPDRRPGPRLHPRYGRSRLRRLPPRHQGAGAAISNRHSIRTEWFLGSDALETGEDFDRFRDQDEHTAYADVRLAASRRFLDSHRSGGLTPAATAAHLRDHGHGPWGAPGSSGPNDPPPTEVGADFSGVSVCMHVRGHSVTAASMIAVLPAGICPTARRW